MKVESITTVIAVAVVIIASLVAYNTIEDKRITSLEKSIEIATQRGIDPVAVRCAYVKENDTICVVYAAKAATK